MLSLIDLIISVIVKMACVIFLYQCFLSIVEMLAYMVTLESLICFRLISVYCEALKQTFTAEINEILLEVLLSAVALFKAQYRENYHKINISGKLVLKIV